MEGTHRYEIARGFRWLILGISYLFLIGLAAGAASVLGSGEAESDEIVLLALCGISFGGMALYGLWVGHRPAHYAVEMFSEGLIRPATGRMIPWSSVARFRERPILHRIDLIDHAADTVATLEYQLDGFEDALRTALESCPDASPHESLPASFEGRAGAGRRALRSLLVTSESVVLRRGSAEREVPLSDVTDVRLGLRALGQGQQALWVYLSLADGTVVPVLPDGVSPFPIYATIRDAWEKSRAHVR
jgi:hypothetical protein